MWATQRFSGRLNASDHETFLAIDLVIVSHSLFLFSAKFCNPQEFLFFSPCLALASRRHLTKFSPSLDRGGMEETRQGPDVARTRYNNFCLAPDAG